jgi:hypothetical protein
MMGNPTNQGAEKTSKTSALGLSSAHYLTKTSEKGSILDQPELGLLEFYPAGYTKPDKENNDRQVVYQALYEEAVRRDKEEQLYPLGKEGHDIVLIPDFDNPHDKHAMVVRLVVFGEKDPLYRFNGRDIGFVPMKITSALAPNRGMISQGRILKVRNGVHAKYFSAKVVLSYGERFSTLDRTSAVRFSSLLED